MSEAHVRRSAEREVIREALEVTAHYARWAGYPRATWSGVELVLSDREKRFLAWRETAKRVLEEAR